MIDKITFEKIKEFEGCRLNAYKCPAGVWTIGFGHVDGVKKGMRITQEEAEAFLIADLDRFEKHVDGYKAKYNWSENERSALVSFAFNIGSIDQLTADGTRSKAEIAEKMLLYVHAGDQVLEGLVTRRQWEHDHFLSGSAAKEKEFELPMIYEGSCGKLVRVWQMLLGDVSVDGMFGRNTKQSTIRFQKNHNLVGDGIVGPLTWGAMFKTL